MAEIIKNIFTQEALASLLNLEKDFVYESGKKTARGSAKEIKENLQADMTEQGAREAATLLHDFLLKSAGFCNATAALKVSAPLFAKYEKGMTYGFHYDNAIMHGLRTDLSCTVFLNDDYEGGELEIKMPYGMVKLKGKAGQAIVYPANSYHRVAPVTSGERRVAVLWVQSKFKDPTQREIITDLARALSSMTKEEKESSAYTYVKKSYNDLLRMWSEL